MLKFTLKKLLQMIPMLLLISLLDNLGKGSSGAAVQCMNIMLGLEETKGLEL